MFLVSTRNFPPELGGMQNLMEGLSNALLNHGPVKVFADAHDEAEIYDQNSFNNAQLQTLKLLSNPIHHLLARYKWSWRLFNLHKSSPIRRDIFNIFSKYALTYSDEYSGKESDDKKIVLLNAKKLISDNS